MAMARALHADDARRARGKGAGAGGELCSGATPRCSRAHAPRGDRHLREHDLGGERAHRGVERRGRVGHFERKEKGTLKDDPARESKPARRKEEDTQRRKRARQDLGW